MRARYPDTEGFVERDGVKVAYEVFGSGEPTLVFAPTDPLVHSRAWKAQVPYLARTSRVVTIDPIWFSFDGAESFYLKYIRQAQRGERASSRYAANPVDSFRSNSNYTIKHYCI